MLPGEVERKFRQVAGVTGVSRCKEALVVSYPIRRRKFDRVIVWKMPMTFFRVFGYEEHK